MEGNFGAMCESGEIEGRIRSEVKFDYFGRRRKVKLSEIILPKKKIPKMKLSFFS